MENENSASKKHTKPLNEMSDEEIEKALQDEANKQAERLINTGKLSEREKKETSQFFEKLNGGRFKSEPREISEKEKEYWEQVRQEPKEYTRDEFKLILWHHMQKYLKGAFEMDGNIIEVLNDLVDYFRGKPGKYSQDKGIFLWGGVGLGKSMIMRSFKQTVMLRDNSFDYKPLKDIFLELTKYNTTEPLINYSRGNMCFDDLGFESETVKIYGNTINVWEELLQKRYNHFQAGSQVTHVTSNIAPHENDFGIPTIAECYGDRIASRCNEMFHYIHLKGSDKRK